ncbi:hypothetical protein ScPMuIL_007624 [Solemya velum]
MADLKTCIILVIMVNFVVADIPEGFILDVQHNCSYDPEANAARVEIVTDLDIEPFVFCEGIKKNLEQESKSRYSLNLYYYYYGADQCSFKKPRVTLAVSLNQPMELQGHTGNASEYLVTVFLGDVLYKEIEADSIPRGKLVYIMAKVDVDMSDKIVGLQASSCSVVSTSTSYSVIRGGCGDGLVFNREEGFLTDGTTAISPAFEWFGLEHNDAMRVVCNFTLCEDNCDGTNCEMGRSARDLPSVLNRPEGHIPGESKNFEVLPPVGHMPVFEKILVLDPSEADHMSISRSRSCVMYPLWIGFSVIAVLLFISFVLIIYSLKRSSVNYSANDIHNQGMRTCKL